MAGVTIDVDKREVTKGDTVTFTITAQGDNVVFPVIKQIGGFPILGTSQRSNIAIVNAQVTRTISKSYTFAPMKDVSIPSFDVKVDGRTYRTDPVTIRVVDHPAPGKGGTAGEYLIQMDLDKRKLRVGEPVVMTITLRYPTGQNVVQANIQPPHFENFWIKKVDDGHRRIEGNSVVETYRYLVFPQKSGHFTLGPVTAKIARRVRVKPPIDDPFFNDDFFNGFFARLQWQRVASNAVSVDVDPLPGNVELYGNFSIDAQAARTEVEANKPLKVTITVEGEGNIEDVPKFEPDVPGAVVYADDPKIEEWIKGGVYGGRFMQTITFVADRDFTVPSFVIRYYDPKLDKVVTKKTAPIPIHVIGAEKIPPSKAQSSSIAPSKESPSDGETRIPKSEGKSSHISMPSVSWWLAVLLLLGGFALGVATLIGWQRLIRPRHVAHPTPAARKILRAKNDHELFELLLPYAKEDEAIQTALTKLEANLYGGAHHRIDKKEMAAIVAELEGDR